MKMIYDDEYKEEYDKEYARLRKLKAIKDAKAKALKDINKEPKIIRALNWIIKTFIK